MAKFNKFFYFISIALFSLVLGYSYFTNSKVIYGNDLIPFWLDPQFFLHRMISAYDDYTTAFGTSINFFPQYAPITAITLVIKNIFGLVLANKLLYFFFTIAPFWAMNMFCIKLLRDRDNKYAISLAISIFYTVNFLNYDSFYNGLLNFRSILIFLPLFGCLYIDYLKNNNFIIYVSALVLSVFSFINYTHPVSFVFSVFFLPLTIYIVSFIKKEKFVSFKNALFLLIFFVPMIISSLFFWNGAKELSKVTVSSAHNASLTAGAFDSQKNKSFLDYLSFYPLDISSVWGMNDGNAEKIYKVNDETYYEPIFRIMGLSLFILFVLLVLYETRNKKRASIIFLSGIIMLCLLAMSIYRLLGFTPSPSLTIIQIFRNIPNKLAAFYTFSFGLFLLIMIPEIKLKHKTRLLVLIVLLTLVGNINIIFGTIYRYNFVKIPESYLNDAGKVNQDNIQNNRTIVLPFLNYSWIDLNWGYNGYDPLTYMITGPKITFSGTSLSNKDSFFSSNFVDLIQRGDYLKTSEMLSENSIEYIVFRNDASFKRFTDRTKYSSKESSELLNYLLSTKKVDLFSHNENFDVYKMKKIMPRLSIEGTSVNNLISLSPTDKIFEVNLQDKDKELIFNDNFSANWELFLLGGNGRKELESLPKTLNIRTNGF